MTKGMTMFGTAIRGTLAAALLAGAGTAAAEVPLGDFFKDPEFTSVSLSPTGEYITVSVPQGDRTVLAAFRVADMSLVGKWDYGENKHIESVEWVHDDRFLMNVTLKLGRFDNKVGIADVYASNVDGSRRIDIPNGGTYYIVDPTWNDPSTILVGRSVDSAFLSRLNVYTGRVTTVAQAPVHMGGFVVDHDGKERYAVGIDEQNNSIILRREGDGWVPVGTKVAMGGATREPLGFAPDNTNVYFRVSDQGEPARVVLVSPDGKQTLLSKNDNVDPAGFLMSADGKEMLAVRYMDGTPSYEFINKEHRESKIYAGLINAFPDRTLRFDGISRDGRYFLVRSSADIDPGSYYLFDSQTGKAQFLLSSMEWIKPEQMSPMDPITFTARDGREIHGYLTIPRGSSGKNLPLILHPHGGPHGPRDAWGFNPEVQFLASRGYAVLQVNFRGSGGYGSAHESAGYRNWGTSMIDDMTDAVNWVVGQGIADRNRICTYGASYGGYAALQSVVREPDRYKCTIGYVGLYSIPLWMHDSDVAEGRSDTGRNYQQRVFPATDADRQAQSPAYNVDRIRIPVMLVHGAKDQRVPLTQYEMLKERLEAAGRPPEVTIVEDKEGHGFYDFQNQVDLYTSMEKFLDKYIGDGARAPASP